MSDDVARLLADIAQLAEELCDPHQHTERVWDVDRHRNRRMRRAYTTTQDGLLTQLSDAMVDAAAVWDDGASGRGVPRSRPPGSWEALATHASITTAAARWCWMLGIPQRDTVEASIRGLVGRAPTLDRQQLADLAADIRAWHHRAAVMTGWATPAYAPTAPCPTCEASGTLRVNLGRQSALCVDCGATWTPDTIGVLARYIATVTAQPARRVPVRSSRSGHGGWLADPGVAS
jgi:hypothetical protein